MPYIFSITCQEIKMNLTEFDLTKVNSSIILNPGVRKKLYTDLIIYFWVKHIPSGDLYVPNTNKGILCNTIYFSREM